MSLSTDFPVLDFSKSETDFDGFATELFQASFKWGFFVLTDTGIDADQIFTLSREFFDLPLEQKAEKIMNEQAIGYDGKTKTTFAASEGMTFGTPPGGILNTNNLPLWWSPAKRQLIEAFKAKCYDLSTTLMSCFALKLGLDKEYFHTSHLHKNPGNTLKLIRYPPMADKSGMDVPRLSEHTDWGSITFVFTTQGGLEVRDPENQWCNVPVLPGGIIVNIGDALSLWTGKVLKSTMHRITWENLPLDQNRYSIAYFTNPNYGAILNALRKDADVSDPPITYEDYYNIRLRLTYGSLQDAKTGGKIFKDIDAAKFEAVQRLNVANAGLLESHALPV